MSWIQSQIQRKDGVPINPPPISPLLSPPHSSSSSSSPIPSHGTNKISPAILFIIIILSAIFFISALLHLIVKFLIKHSSSASQELSGSEALQRQLHQLFTLHDSGLDQAFIDALPVFHYKEILGLKEGFDCAVCLCEFSEDDQLRLLPLCSHAFHIDCIDKWLLSNSTCPLCRGSLVTTTDVSSDEHPVFQLDDPRQEENGLIEDVENGFSSGTQKPVEIERIGVETRVFPVRLGRFRRVNNEGEATASAAESSSNNMDARRCYSMGSVEYVVGDSSLQVGVVALGHGRAAGNGDLKLVKGTGESGRMFSITTNNEDVEGKKLNSRSKGESFSVSKIWLWSNKGNKLQSSSSSHTFL